jgi:hypothetical protein
MLVSHGETSPLSIEIAENDEHVNGQRKLYTAEHIAAIDKVLSDELQTCGICRAS